MRRTLIVGLIGAALWVLVHPEMYGYGGEAKFPGWDVIRVFWADLAFAARAVAGGDLPLWNPYDRGGYSFVAEPQSGFFDPVTWLLVCTAVLMGSAPAWLITLKSILYYGIAASGMDAYLRSRKLPTWACAAGTVAFVLCPRLDKLKDQSALWATAWAGWLLLAFHRCIEGPTVGRGIWLGLAVSVAVLSGYPPTVFRLALLIAPLAVLAVIRAVRAAENRPAYGRALGAAVLAALLVVVGLCSAQVQATLSVLPSTERAALPLAEVLATRVQAEHWRGLFGVLDETSPLMIYAGLASTIGVLVAVAVGRSAEAVLLGVLGVLGFALAAGHHLPLLPALAKLPGFRSFRIAAHYLVLTSVSISVLAAMGLALVATASRRQALAVATLAGLGLVAALLLTSELDLVRVILSVATVAATIAIAFAAPRWRPRIGWAVVGLLVVDLFAAARPIAKLLRPYPAVEREQVLVASMTEPDVYRVADFEWAGNRVGPRAGLRDLLGHRPALTDRRYRMVYEAASKSAHLLGAMNVELAAFKRRDRAARTRHVQWIREHKYVVRVKDPWPLAYWVAEWEVHDGPEEVLEVLRQGGAPAAHFERRHLPPRLRDGSPSVEAELEPVAPVLAEYGPNRVVLEVDAPRAGFLVVNESFDPGWSARVDGEASAVLRANLIQRAVWVSPGRHVVELEYAPPGLGWLLVLFGVTLTGAIGWLARERLAARRATRGPAGSPEPSRSSPNDDSGSVV